MDLRQYFKKIRSTEAGLTDSFPLVVSLETADGGKAGTASEVTRMEAAKLIVEGCARLASDDEKKAHFDKQANDKKAAERADIAQRLQVTIVDERKPDAESHDQPVSVPPAPRK
jgi:hypothetical protein